MITFEKRDMAERVDSIQRNNRLIRIKNITTPKFNPTSAPTFHSRITDPICWLRYSYDCRGQGYLAEVLAFWVLDLGGLIELAMRLD
jgi:hypothetical protein